MFDANWKALMIVGMLLPAATPADDEILADNDPETLPESSLAVGSLPTESAYSSRWFTPLPDETPTYAVDWSRSITDVDFQDDSTIARYSKIRDLSLLTLARFGQTRLFLGINDDGLVGIHLRAIPNDSGGRYLEVVKMPYLNDTEPDSEVDETSSAAH